MEILVPLTHMFMETYLTQLSPTEKCKNIHCQYFGLLLDDFPVQASADLLEEAVVTRSPAERHVAMSWAQRLKRVFNIDIEACGRCGGSLKVIACVEDQDIIDRILAHLRDKELATPSLPLLTPPSRAPPETLPLFAGKDSSSTAHNQQGSH